MPKSRNGSENFAMISKVRNGSQVQNGLDLHNNSKHFVKLSTFGIFSKSARNAAETPDSETGNDYMWKHPPSAFPALPTCNKLLPNLLLFFFGGGGGKVYYFILRFLLKRRRNYFYVY